MEKGVGVGKNTTNKKEFVSPPPHSWLGRICSVKHEQIC